MTKNYEKMNDGCCHKTVTERCEDCPFNRGPDFHDGPDSEGFHGARPWNNFETEPNNDG